jgi:sigma-B regulation protein RsbU (phosphoserine phosphatase)
MAAKSQAEQAMLEERTLSELREQFIAVLGHDLRNPLASIAAGVRLLKKDPPKDRAEKILGLMEGSVVRAATLIDNVLDFARARLGAGIGVDLKPDAAVAPIIEQVVSELRSVAGDRSIIDRVAINEPVTADASRIGQLTSNLLSNALTHGAADQPVQLEASTRDGQFVLSVANGGAPIEPVAMSRLFQPFFRGSIRPSQQGLGLGLHIAAEIAKEHGGAIALTSDDRETRFTFTMPCQPQRV